MRIKFIAGNWKMFTNHHSAEALALAVVRAVKDSSPAVTLALCPPFPYLECVSRILAGTQVRLGAQNLYPELEGAYTGEVSPDMLVDVGCQYAIVGHSERRHKLGESDAFINRKVHAALQAGLIAILCVGETLEERERGQTESILDTQLTSGLAGISGEHSKSVVLAYEPVWAIGTGRNATPDQAQAAHVFLRRRAAELCGTEAAGELLIQYGGSVKPENAGDLLKQQDIDGALVGGASLKADQFLAIVHAAL